ncbi:MAG: hypothetical protein WC718_04265 [Phycisphaerales bacterium]
MARTQTEEQVMSLVEFARQGRLAEARARCPVCQLPQDVQDELRDSQRRGTERRWQIAWLRAMGHNITNAELTTHRNGGHDG